MRRRFDVLLARLLRLVGFAVFTVGVTRFRDPFAVARFRATALRLTARRLAARITASAAIAAGSGANGITKGDSNVVPMTVRSSNGGV